MAAHDPERRARAESAKPTLATLGLDDLIAHRTAELTAYQNSAYAARYAMRVSRVRAAEGALGGEALTRAVAINLYKLMAYKDEYEVARLYADPRFAEALRESFTGGKAKVWLAPPLIAPKDTEGRPRKIALGGWMIRWVFPALARLKGLRGTPLDLFGATAERRMERALISQYEAGLDRLIAGLTADRLPLAKRIAEVPAEIRGFGHVKAAAAEAARERAAALWAQWASV